MDTKEINLWDEEIHKVARYLCREHPDVEFDDMKQDLWLVLLAAHDKGKLLELDDKYLRTTLRLKGTEICNKYRQQHLTISPQYGYRTKDVRNLFETFWFYEDWLNAEIPDDALTTDRNPKYVKQDEGIHLTADLSVAYDKLPKNYQDIIYRAFREREDLTDTERKLLSAALARTADILNTYRGVRG